MNVDGFDLNLLVAFEALIEERHVTRAAMRTGVSQPAMSAALRRLRLAASDELFVRGPKGLSPTPRALELARPVAVALREVREALALRRAFEPSSSRQTFRIAASDHPASVLLPRLVGRVTSEAPGVDLRIRAFRGRREASDLLDEGRIDMAIGVSPGHEARILHADLFSESFVTIARAGTPSASIGDPAGFAAARHLLVSPESEDHGVVDDALAQLGLRRRIVVSVAHIQAAVAIVAETDLIATVMLGVVQASRLGSRLLIVPPPLALEPITFQALWHRRTDGDAGHAWFRSLVKDEATQQW